MPFTFLSSLGGKQTSSFKLTPKLEYGHQYRLKSDGNLEKDASFRYNQEANALTTNIELHPGAQSTQLTIFTNVDVDKHTFDKKEKEKAI